MQKFAEQLERDIVKTAQLKLIKLASMKTASPGGAALLALLGAGAGALGGGALGNIMASPETMYDNGVTAGYLDLKPTPAYEGQDPVPWYRNIAGKEWGTALGALAGLGGGTLAGANLGAIL